MTTQHTLSIRMRNRSVTLARIVMLFLSRDVGIESLSLEPADPDTGLSRLEVVVRVRSDRTAEQLVKQVERLVDVHRAVESTAAPVLSRA